MAERVEEIASRTWKRQQVSKVVDTLTGNGNFSAILMTKKAKYVEMDADMLNYSIVYKVILGCWWIIFKSLMLQL